MVNSWYHKHADSHSWQYFDCEATQRDPAHWTEGVAVHRLTDNDSHALQITVGCFKHYMYTSLGA